MLQKLGDTYLHHLAKQTNKQTFQGYVPKLLIKQTNKQTHQGYVPTLLIK